MMQAKVQADAEPNHPKSNHGAALDRPILIIAPARSGTHLLASIIGLHDDVAYLAEPNYVWKYANAWIGHDMIPASRATPEVCRYIRARFERFCAEAGKRRFCEKTPANSLRLPFVMRVMPDARVIHVVRDGRDVAASARKKFYGDPAKISRLSGDGPAVRDRRTLNYRSIPRIVRRARQRLSIGVPARDFIHYVPHFVQSMLTLVGLKKRHIWGPRIPGIRQLFRSHSDIEVAAIQWRTSVESVLNYRANHPEMAYLEVRYEELCADPVNVARRIYEFCELEFSPAIEGGVRSLFAESAKISSLQLRMSPEEERLVNDQIAQTLQLLGYDPGAAAGKLRHTAA
jgi:hypothetical protein